MAHMLRKHHQRSSMSPRTPQELLSLRRDSRVISKVQPKIRIIHIFAPEIIHTDVSNFRELVQRLTGKPSSSPTTTTTSTSSGSLLEKKTKPSSNPMAKLPVRPEMEVHNKVNNPSKKDNHSSYGSYDHRDHGGFLEAFEGVDCFMQELCGFSLSMEANPHHHHHHLNPFGETHHSLAYKG